MTPADRTSRLESAHPADESPGLLLWQITNRWQSAQRAALKPYGLTHVQFVLLASLVWLDADDPVTQVRLAEQAATDPMMTSQVVRTLEAKGLLTRAKHPSDGRAVVLSPTAAGVDLANEAVAVVEACDRAFFEVLGDSTDRFVAMMQKLRRSEGRQV